MNAKELTLMYEKMDLRLRQRMGMGFNYAELVELRGRLGTLERELQHARDHLAVQRSDAAMSPLSPSTNHENDNLK